eukprot:g5093.t1
MQTLEITLQKLSTFNSRRKCIASAEFASAGRNDLDVENMLSALFDLLQSQKNEETVKLASEFFRDIVNSLATQRRFSLLSSLASTLCPRIALFLAKATFHKSFEFVIECCLAPLLLGFQHSHSLCKIVAPTLSLIDPIHSEWDEPSLEKIRKIFASLIFKHSSFPTSVAPLCQWLQKYSNDEDSPSSSTLTQILREASWIKPREEKTAPWIEGLYRLECAGSGGGGGGVDSNPLSMYDTAVSTGLDVDGAEESKGDFPTNSFDKAIEGGYGKLVPESQRLNILATARCNGDRIIGRGIANEKMVLQGSLWCNDSSTGRMSWRVTGHLRTPNGVGDDDNNLNSPDGEEENESLGLVLEWQCAKCTFINSGNRTKCEACGVSAPPKSFARGATGGESSISPFSLRVGNDGNSLFGEWAQGSQRCGWIAQRTRVISNFMLTPDKYIESTEKDVLMLSFNGKHFLDTSYPVSCFSPPENKDTMWDGFTLELCFACDDNIQFSSLPTPVILAGTGWNIKERFNHSKKKKDNVGVGLGINESGHLYAYCEDVRLEWEGKEFLKKSNQAVVHVALVYKAVTKSVTLYVDGHPVSKEIISLSEKKMSNENDLLRIGCGFFGAIWHVKTWTRALKDSEVVCSMGTFGLEAYWPLLGESEAAVLRDASPGTDLESVSSFHQSHRRHCILRASSANVCNVFVPIKTEIQKRLQERCSYFTKRFEVVVDSSSTGMGIDMEIDSADKHSTFSLIGRLEMETVEELQRIKLHSNAAIWCEERVAVQDGFSLRLGIIEGNCRVVLRKGSWWMLSGKKSQSDRQDIVTEGEKRSSSILAIRDASENALEISIGKSFSGSDAYDIELSAIAFDSDNNSSSRRLLLGRAWGINPRRNSLIEHILVETSSSEGVMRFSIAEGAVFNTDGVTNPVLEIPLDISEMLNLDQHQTALVGLCAATKDSHTTISGFSFLGCPQRTRDSVTWEMDQRRKLCEELPYDVFFNAKQRDLENESHLKNQTDAAASTSGEAERKDSTASSGGTASLGVAESEKPSLAAENLASMLSEDPRLCDIALRRSNGDVNRAAEWLMSESSEVQRERVSLKEEKAAKMAKDKNDISIVSSDPILESKIDNVAAFTCVDRRLCRIALEKKFGDINSAVNWIMTGGPEVDKALTEIAKEKSLRKESKREEQKEGEEKNVEMEVIESSSAEAKRLLQFRDWEAEEFNKRRNSSTFGQMFDINGTWDSSIGNFHLCKKEDLVGLRISGTYGYRGGGGLVGTAFICKNGKWKFEGECEEPSAVAKKSTFYQSLSQHENDQMLAHPLKLHWSDDASQFSGMDYRTSGRKPSTICNEWAGKLCLDVDNFRLLAHPLSNPNTNSHKDSEEEASDANASTSVLTEKLAGMSTSDTSHSTIESTNKKTTKSLSAGRTGLLNMQDGLINVCYQNSVLQALFMTTELRSALLSLPYGRKALAYAGVPLDSISSSKGEHGSLYILTALQQLFARLELTQRPLLTTHALQRCLPNRFSNGKQQDSTEFRTFVMEALEASQRVMSNLQMQPSGNDDNTALMRMQHHKKISDIFRCSVAYVRTCMNCGNEKYRAEEMSELQLSFPRRYTAIVGIEGIVVEQVVGRTTAAKPSQGYERVNKDINKERRGKVPKIFLALRRADSHNQSEQKMIVGITLRVFDRMVGAQPPEMQGFHLLNIDLNQGGQFGKSVYLYYQLATTGSPITDIDIISGAEGTPDGFRKINVDLNGGIGNRPAYVVYKKDMPISKIKIHSEGIRGYRYIDVDLNMVNDLAPPTYLLCSQGDRGIAESAPVTDVKLVSASERERALIEGWEDCGMVNGQYLMQERGEGCPIYQLEVFRAPVRVPKFSGYENAIELYSPSRSSKNVATSNVVVQGTLVPAEDVTDVETIVMDDDVVQGESIGGEEASEIIEAKAVSIDDDIQRAIAMSMNDSTTDGKLKVVGADAVVKVPMHPPFSRKNPPPLVGSYVAVSRGVSNKNIVRFTSVDLAESLNGLGYVVRGSYDGRGGGEIDGIAFVKRSIKNDSSEHHNIWWEFTGTWKDDTVKQAQLCLMEGNSDRFIFTPASNSPPLPSYLQTSVSQAKSFISAEKTTETVKVAQHITDITIVTASESPPSGYEVIRHYNGHSASLVDGTGAAEDLYFAIKRGGNEQPIVKVGMIWPEFGESPPSGEGWHTVFSRPSGSDASLNTGVTTSSGNANLIYLTFQRAPLHTPPSEMKALLNIGTLWGDSDSCPNGFKKLAYTGLGMKADLNAGCNSSREIYLCTEIGPAPSPTIMEGHSQIVNGVYNSIELGKVQLQVIRQCPVWVVKGKYSASKRGSASGVISGHLIENVHKDTSSTKWLLSGSWLDGVDVLRQGNPCRWEFDSNFENSKGSWTADSSAKKLNSWDLVRDNYLKLAFKRDVNTLWRGGKMVFTDRLSNNDVQLLLNRHLSPCVIPADATGGCCESCGAIASRQEQAVLLAPPRHLTLTLKRAEYDATAKRAVKKLCTVNFPPKIIVPALPGDCDTKRVGSVIAGRRDYEYRLYAVVMHAGRSASAGHYFAFARPSSEVHAEDQNWTRFNDMKVTSVTLEKMCSIARDHPENTCYFMIYHLVGPLSKEAKNEDETEDEEMLKLALAMSKQNDSNEHSTELSSKIPVEGEDASSLSEEERGKTLRYQKLEDVENENSKFFFGEFEHRTTKLYVDQIKRRSALVLNSSTE